MQIAVTRSGGGYGGTNVPEIFWKTFSEKILIHLPVKIMFSFSDEIAAGPYEFRCLNKVV